MFQDGLLRSILSESLGHTIGKESLESTILPFSASPRKPNRQTGVNTQQPHCFPTFPFQQFQVLFHSLFKVLFIFPSRYLFAIGLPSIFSFRWNLPPIRAAIPNNSTLRSKVLDKTRYLERGYHPLWRVISDDFSITFIPDLYFCRLHPRRFQPELFPLHSPLLREYLLVSFPPLSYMLKFSGYSYLIGGPIEKTLSITDTTTLWNPDLAQVNRTKPKL